MHHLSGETIRLLSSAQVITSVLNAAKELLENALDAGADSVDVKLENFGLDKIEVRDNGSGITCEDVPLMGQRHYTSKLSEFHDLATVTSYGFRGEALASLCAVADVCVTTKQAHDDISRIHVLNHNGEVMMTKPSHLGNGTTVTATNMFTTLPVRRQYYNNSFSRKKDELRKVTDLVMCYGYVNPGVRLTLSHNKKVVWQKSKVASCRVALSNIMGSNVMSQLVEVEQRDDDTEVSLRGFLPRRGGDPHLVGRAHNDRCWMYINKRPVNFKEAEKLIKKSFSHCLTEGAPVKNIVACLHFVLPTEAVDVNLEPDKRKVLLQNKNAVLSLLTEVVNEVYAKPRTPKKSRQDPDKAAVTPHKEPRNDVCKRLDGNLPSNRHTDDCDSRVDDVISQTADTAEEQTSHEVAAMPANIAECELRMNPEEGARKRDEVPNHTSTSGDADDPSFSLFDDELFQDTQKTGPQQPLRTGLVESDGSGDGNGISGIKTPAAASDGQAGEPSFSLFDDGLFESTQKTNHQQTGAGTPPDGHVDSDAPRHDLTSIIRNASESATRDIRQFEKGAQIDPTLKSPDCTERDNRDVRSTVGNKSGDEGISQDTSKGRIRTELVDRESSASDWSKGVLLGAKSAPVEPVKLLVPGSGDNHGDGINLKIPYIHKPSKVSDNGGDAQRDVLSRLPSMESALECSIGQLPGNVMTMDTSSRQHGSSSEGHSKCQKLPADCDESNQSEQMGLLPDSVDHMRTTDLDGAGMIAVPQDASARLDEHVVPAESKSAAERRNLGLGVSDAVPRTSVDRLDGAPRNGINTSLEGYTIPKVSGFIPVQKPSVAQPCIPAVQTSIRSDKTDTPASIKKKPTLPANPAKRKRASKKNHLISNQGLINEMLASQEQKQSLPAVTTNNVPFSVSSLSGYIKNNAVLQEGVERDQPRLICKLRQLWVVLENSQILLFNHFRAEEVVLYHRLLATHVLPTVSLDVPITLNVSMFESRSSWLTLLSMKTSHAGDNPISEYTDQRLIANGFEIRRLIDKENRDIVLQITAISDLLPCYGTADLQEILDQISASPGIKLKDCRPLKVSNYLKGEAVRIVRNRPSSLSEEEAQTLITSVRNISSAPSTCLHGKPLFIELCSLDNDHSFLQGLV